MCVKFRSQWVHLVSHPLPLIKDNLCVLSFPLPTTPPGRLLPSKHARTGQYQHCPAHNRRYGHPKGPVYLPYGLHTGKRGGPAPRPHRAPYRLPVPAPYRFARTGPAPFSRNGPIPFCPYRPRTVLPVPAHTILPVPAPYRFVPVLPLQAITNPYRPGTAAVLLCPYRRRTVLPVPSPYRFVPVLSLQGLIAVLVESASVLFGCVPIPNPSFQKSKFYAYFTVLNPIRLFFFLSFFSFLDHHTQKSRSRQSGNRNKSRDDCSHSMPVFCWTAVFSLLALYNCFQ